nr:CobW family GTP-binding protein [Sphingobium sp. JAI105]
MIPIIVVTGFLGAGKTTLLHEMLKDESFHRSAIIVNEVGDIGFDRDALRTTSTPEPTLLSGGCVCCAMRQDLVYTLRDLVLRRRKGLVPAIDQIIVETTGIADPSNMLAQIAADPWARSTFAPVRVLTVVDALNDDTTWANNIEARNQLAFADAVHLSKLDLIDDRKHAALIKSLGLRAPWAERLRANDFAGLKAALLQQTGMAKSSPPQPRRCCDGHEGHAISTAKVAIECRIAWGDFSSAIDRTAAQHKPDLLRCKGVVRVSDVSQPLLIQSVRHRFARPVPFEGYDDIGYLAIIARGDKAAQIAESLRENLAAALMNNAQVMTDAST